MRRAEIAMETAEYKNVEMSFLRFFRHADQYCNAAAVHNPQAECSIPRLSVWGPNRLLCFGRATKP
jgi:hypothetical protein